MTEWKEVKVGDLGKVLTGKTPKTSETDNYGGDIPFITPSDDMTVKYIYSTNKKLTEKGAQSVKNNIIPEKAICVSCIGSDLGKVVISTERSVTNQQINSIIINEAKYDVDYIYYVMTMLGKIMNHHSKTSTAVPIVNKSQFSEYTFLCPELKVQKKIGEILSSIDSKIMNNEAINRNLTEQFRAIVDEFVVQLEDFELKRLDEIAECQNGHAFYKEGYDEEGAFVIDLGNVNTSANFVYTNADKYISMERYEQAKLEKYRVFKDDLVMVMTDRKSTMELLGKTGKVYKDGYYVLNQRMYRIRAKEGINVNYLYAILNSTKVCNGLKEKALGSVQKYVNTKEINEIEVIVPSPEKMDELAQLVNPISSQMEINILENENLQKLRDELLPKLMSGQLDVSDLDI